MVGGNGSTQVVHRKRRRHQGVAAMLLAIAALVWCTPSTSRAAGLLRADGGFGGQLELVEHAAAVTINNGIAVTRVSEVFRNLEDRQVEALYTFPVPGKASVSGFSMWINGTEMVGEVVEKERARAIYESYKQQNRDPGLLEQSDFKTFELRIFPIPAKAEQRVEITYYQEVDVDHDWGTWVFPLSTTTFEGVPTRTSARFALDFHLKSEVPIAELSSPSHPDDFVVAAHGEDYAQASLETREGDLNRDLVLAWRTERPRTGFDLVASRHEDEDGYFCLTVTAGEDLERSGDSGMDYVFVLDVSGSMADDGKLQVSRNQIGAFVRELGEQDRFQLLAFNVQPAVLFQGLAKADAENVERGMDFLERQEAKGGTVLAPALGLAYKYKDPDRTLNVVVLSDGMTGARERGRLSELIRGRPSGVRVFCVGVGNDVNRPLLEQVAREAGGLAAFVSRGDDFARQAAAFRRKLVRPAATNLALDFGKLKVYDLEPEVLPNLFHGMPVRVYGRYKKGGSSEITLRGDLGGRDFASSAAIELPRREEGKPEIDRMWAWHRMQRLEETQGEAAAAEIVRLGEGYSIAGKYTSFLVLENDAEYRRWSLERRNALRIDRDRKAQDRFSKQLESLRQKSLGRIGPGEPEGAGGGAPTARSSDRAQRGPAMPELRVNGNPGGGGGGTGPVGPLMVGLLALARWAGKRGRKNGKGA